MTSFNSDGAIVRILSDDKDPRQPKGAGVLVSSRYVVTCYHVIETICKDPSTPVYLDFPLLEGRPIAEAGVRAQFPVNENASVGEPEDIAVLKLSPEISLPPGAKPAILRDMDSNEFNKCSVSVCGFPEGMDNGDRLNGELMGIIGDGSVQLDHDLGSRCIVEGFSGTPVWDDPRKNVLGIIVARNAREGIASGYMIPASALLKVIPKEAFAESGTAGPKLLPYLVDRREQVTAIRATLKTRQSHHICLIHGDERESHDKFLECLQVHYWKNICSPDADQAAPKLIDFICPTHSDDFGDFKAQVARQLHEYHVRQAPPDDSDAIFKAINACHKGPILIYTFLYTKDGLQKRMEKIIRRFLRLWEKWPARSEDNENPLIACLVVCYLREDRQEKGIVQVAKRVFARGLRYKHINKKIRKALMSKGRSDMLVPELLGIQRGDAYVWRNAFKEYIRPDISFEDEILSIYQSPENVRGRIPMSVLARELRKMIISSE